MDVERILLGLLAEPSCGASRVLKRCGVAIDTLNDQVESSLSPSQTAEQAKHAVQFAVEEARAMGNQHVGTEHLLIGILRTPHSTAARLLSEAGVSLSDLRRFAGEMTGALPDENT